MSQNTWMSAPPGRTGSLPLTGRRGGRPRGRRKLPSREDMNTTLVNRSLSAPEDPGLPDITDGNRMQPPSGGSSGMALRAMMGRLERLEATVSKGFEDVNRRIESLEKGGSSSSATPPRRRPQRSAGKASAYASRSSPLKTRRQGSVGSSDGRVEGWRTEDERRATSPTSGKRRASTAVGEERVKQRMKERSGQDALSRLSSKKDADTLAEEVLAQQARKARMQSYRFGSRKLFVMAPTDAPEPEQASAEVNNELALEYAYGYNGRDIQSRRNLFRAETGELIYYLAAVGVVLDPRSSKMKFFFGHNDDITCADFNTKTGWVATGQVDPKDVPGAGKALPMINIWHYQTLELVKCIDSASWGQVKKVAWSPVSKYLYSMGGEDSQPITAWDISRLAKGGKKTPKVMQIDTYREEAFGMMAMSSFYKKDTSCDELVVFGRRKCSYLYVQEKKKKGKTVLEGKLKNVGLTKIKGGPRATEKAFLCVSRVPGSAQYLIGSPGGYVFLCCGETAFTCYKAHEMAIGDMICIDQGRIVTASFDSTVKVLALPGPSGGNITTLSVSKPIALAGSDFEMAPRTIVYGEKKLYIGTKSNQIVSTDLKGTSVEMVVDGHDDQVWGLCSHPSEPYICTGGYDNCIKIWHTTKHKNTETYLFPTTTVLKDNGDERTIFEKVVTCAWSEDGSLVAVGTESSKIALFGFDTKNGDGRMLTMIQIYTIPPKTKNAQVESVAYLRFSADNNLLGVAHMDSGTYIFDISKKTLSPWSRKSLSEVAAPSHIQFSADNTMLRVFTRDYEISHWTLDADRRKGKRYAFIPDPDDTKWAGDPLIAGWDVQGLYQAEWDGTDLNDAAVTDQGDVALIASGDDYGWVRLHNYPALDKDKHQKYQAHSSFVVGVEWSGDGDYLMTVGGNDYAIFQWRLEDSEF